MGDLKKLWLRIRIRSDSELFAGSGIGFLPKTVFYLITMCIRVESGINCQVVNIKSTKKYL